MKIVCRPFHQHQHERHRIIAVHGIRNKGQAIPGVIVRDMVADLESALEQLKLITEDLGRRWKTSLHDIESHEIQY